MKGKTAEEEDHPNTKNWIRSLFDFSTKKGVKLDWINCGLCLDERGAESIDGGPRRGGPKNFVEWVQGGGQVLIIPTR